MTTKITVIGCGNLGNAVIKGLARAERDYHIVACDKIDEKLEAVDEYVDETTSDAAESVENADIIALAVKPDVAGAVLDSIDLLPSQYLVSF
ncbi:MAG: NAD(P)-binding domain-containing protein, partial [Halobacteria archaeon]|nr:NAD(P)-binding domain-containing protein [Halobacteria archaeon]